MKRAQNQHKKNQKKIPEISNNINNNKRTTQIADNISSLLNFFKVSSVHKSISTNADLPQSRQNIRNFNRDKTEPQKNYRLSRYKFYDSKNKKNTRIEKDLNKIRDENINKIDVSHFILFSENFSEKINKIFSNNFIRNFKSYLESNFENDRKSIGPRQDINISKNLFNKFIQQSFKHFITKYLLNSYHDLIYVSLKYILEKNNKNDFSEIELLCQNDKSNINLEYSPINITESNLFYPNLTTRFVKFIKNFRQKKRKKKPNHALLLYRPNNDFTSFINKLRLISAQMGYNLLIKEDEINKIMTIEKLKLINQNYIIGSVKDKFKKYLQIINNLSTTEKWKKFIEENNINLIEQNETTINKSQQNLRSKNVSKSQSTINSTQSISKRIVNNRNKNKINDILSNSLLTFIGHNNNEQDIKENKKKNTSIEYAIGQNYQQNILEKFNKRKNVILFLDDFEENEENEKYINQINSIIPDSKSPIIILTNNLSLFMNSLIGNINSQIKYIPYQIENEGINQKENIIYMTLLIIYFIGFFPKAVIENKKKDEIKTYHETSDKKKSEIEKEKEIENEFEFIIQIKDDDSDNDIQGNIAYDNNLYKIEKLINNKFIDTDLKLYQNRLYSSLLALSYIITIINSYELDNILVYLKNLFQSIEKQFNSNTIKQTPVDTLSLIQSTILEDIKEYQIDNNDIISDEEELSKLSEQYEKDSFIDYEYGFINRIGEKIYEEKLKNYSINKGIDYNKESYFYTNIFSNLKNNSNKFNHISNNEVESRIIEDQKFFQNYYPSNPIFNCTDIMKLNMIFIQIIFNERITADDISRFIGVRYSKRNNLNKNFDISFEKITVLNKIFRKCPFELFSKYINAHIGIKYYVEFNFENKTYKIPDRMRFYNYYNDYYLMEKIQSEQKKKFTGIEDDDDDDDDENDFNDSDESELNEEESEL